jgi:hypothetical protein
MGTTIPTHIPSVKCLKKAFTTEWRKNCGLSLMEWITCAIGAWVWSICGARPHCDIDSVKKSKDHTISHDQGWACTEFVGGRNKLHGNKRGTRPWAVYYLCMCPGGVHRPVPDSYYCFIRKDGNPDKYHKPNFCTVCPVNWLALKEARMNMRDEPLRVFAKWCPSRHRFGQNHGDVVKYANLWFKVQGAEEGGRPFDSNSGRRGCAGWLQESHAPYHEGFELHGDL